MTTIGEALQQNENKIILLRNQLRKYSTLILTTTQKTSKSLEQQYTDYLKEYVATLEEKSKLEVLIKDSVANDANKKHYLQYEYISYSSVSKDKPKKPIHIEQKDDNLRDLIMKIFPFATEDQCNSTKRSSPHYKTKIDMLQLISGNDFLKTRAPKDYKKMSKEQLCRLLSVLGKLPKN